ncbi:hypothetical protein L1889_07010 [Paenalcaligenes niemegkensis]|nr:hypothetical protein [Paenalcaligenes niemegkensis]
MSAQLVGRLSVALFLVAVVSGCSGPGGSSRSLECRWDPDSCMHEGSYEPGEEEYAEKEAKDLNREPARKLRRKSGWW